MIRDSMLLDESYEIRRRVPRQRRLVKVRIRREVILRSTIYIREVTTAAAGDENLASDLRVMFHHYDTTAPFACLDGTHETGRSRADNHDVEGGRVTNLRRLCLPDWSYRIRCGHRRCPAQSG